MRVAVFTDNDFDEVNGMTTALTALTSYAPADIQPRIYTAATLGSDTPSYLALRSVAFPMPFHSGLSVCLPKWRAYLRQVVADRIELIHLTTPGPMGLTALWIAARTGLPLMGSFHIDLAAHAAVLSGSSRLGGWMGRYVSWLYGRCRRTLVPSESTRAMLVAGGASPERIGRWTEGVDTTLFSPLRRSNQLRERWGVSAHTPVLLYVGRLSREKGLEVLPEVLRRLQSAGMPHRLVVVGDGPLRRWLADRCSDAVFVGWPGREGVADIVASADLFVFPSPTETAANVVLESQSSAVPVLVSASGGSREQMIEGVTGTVCGGADAAAWAAAIIDLLEQTVSRRAMAVAARQYAVGRRWDLALAGVYDTYREFQRPHAGPQSRIHRAA